MNNGLEIERKYLIRMPNEDMLRAGDCQVWEIEQTYLQSGKDGETRRVRRIVENGTESFIYTCKQHINALSQREEETEITGEEYARKLREADDGLRTIRKRRLRTAYRGQILEVDVYPFWNDRAILEVEMESEDQQILLPVWIRVIKEVTEDRRYKNNRLAREIPMDDIVE